MVNSYETDNRFIILMQMPANRSILRMFRMAGNCPNRFQSCFSTRTRQLTLRLSGDPYWCAQLEQTNESGTYNKDVTVTVKATAENNYDFLSWTEYGSSEVLSNQPEYSFKITKNTHLVAHFQFNPKDNPKDPGVGYYNVITYVQPHRGGSLRQSGQGIYQQGDSVTFR